MKLKLFTTKFVILLSVTYALLYSCANVASISGGPKDSLSPVVLGSKPEVGTTNFNGKKIIIYFNEYFELKDISKEFVSSPPFQEMPKFTVKKKALHIKFQEDLLEDVTYNLKFGNAVADYHEGNIYKDMQFVFSTKNEIDSFAISGNLKNAFDLQVPENTFVTLFRENTDSIPFQVYPDYMAKIDSAGDFNIDYIEKGTYKIFAVNDMNGNKLADIFEPRAFLDSLIITEIEPFTKIDSLKAGTILHDEIDPSISDSLTRDTVIITNTHITKPANLQLYLFEEERFMQKIVDFSRKQKEKVFLKFDLTTDSSFRIEPLNFDMPFEDMIIEKNLKKDSIVWWIQDTTIMAQDSLEAIIHYSTKDSLGICSVKQDTLLFEFRKKKEREYKKNKKEKEEEKKAKPQVYIQPKYLTNNNNIDLKNILRLELPTPIKKLDTTKIKLYEIYDTLTIDTKKQEITQFLRLSKDKLYFKFRRKIAKNFKLIPLNFKKENWYTQNVSDSNRVYNVHITDSEVSQIDTLRILAKYDNHFFFSQIQEIQDTLEIPMTSYKILARKRTSAKEMQLVFDRPVNSRVQVELDDFIVNENWYTISKNTFKDTITININDKKVSDLDTLTFSVKCFNFIDLQGDSSYFEQTMRLVYKETPQFLSSVSRLQNDSISLIFNKTVATDPQIDIIGISESGEWYELKKNIEGDSLQCQIINQEIAKKDSLNLILSYSNTDRKGNIEEMQDTVLIIKGRSVSIKDKSKLVKDNSKAAEKEQTVSIYLPRQYIIYADSLKMRNYIIKHEWEEDTKYRLALDSMAFIDIFGVYNKESKETFSTRKDAYYTALVIDLQNIDAQKYTFGNNALSTDSAKQSEDVVNISESLRKSIVGNGDIILQLLDKNDGLVREFFVHEDGKIVIDYLHPGEYKLKIIYDLNKNGKWDTGNYFKKLQAERVIMNGKPLMLKTNFENNLSWDVGKTLVESCYATKDL